MDCSFQGQRGITITNTFQKILDNSNCRPNKNVSDLYNGSMK